MKVQDKIKQLMYDRGWTDYRLAKESGLSHSTISNMFARNNAPTLPTLEAICDAFGITLCQFFAEGDEPIILTPEQNAMLKKWNTLTETQKKILLDLMNTM
ncbi:MAG: helix-turn-helix transcriptional regulator [Clostridia bacterium]|nr:helix-turn-helix transcriptional regulator [Clostridia bacterium]